MEGGFLGRFPFLFIGRLDLSDAFRYIPLRRLDSQPLHSESKEHFYHPGRAKGHNSGV